MRERCPNLEELAQSLEGKWDAHAAQCPACAELLEELRRDQWALQTSPEIPEEALEAVRQSVMARIPRVRQRRYAWAVAMAASLALAALLTFQLQYPPVKPPQVPEIAKASTVSSFIKPDPEIAKPVRRRKSMLHVRKAVESPINLELLETLLRSDKEQEVAPAPITNAKVIALDTKDPEIKILLVTESTGGVQ